MSTNSSLAAAGPIVVLGATGGIGSATAHALHARGARLCFAGRDADRLAELAGPLDARTAVLEGLRPEQIQAAVDSMREGEKLGGLVHCVGSLLLKPAHLTSSTEWDDVLATNLTSAFGAVQVAAKSLAKGASAVLVSSAAAQAGLANHEAIAAAKAGVGGLVRAAAASYARRGLRFNAVAPGLVRSPMTAPMLAKAGMEEACRQMNPLQRIGEPADIAAAIVWLLDPDNAWVTGQILHVDGGLAHLRPTR